MNAPASLETLMPASAADEGALLMRLESLLEDEEAALANRDVDGLTAIAQEREHVSARLFEVVRARRTGAPLDAASEAALMALYQRLRDRHRVQAQVVRCHAERNARAVGVLAQATGQSSLYNAEGRVAMQFVAV